MGFNLIILLLIVLVTLYLATQGMLSSMIALVTATFSSILAMALMEPLQGIIGGWRPDYGRGITFLALYFLIFSATRIVADIAVPNNIKVSIWINRGAGGFLGFFTALVVIGNIVIGLEMLPLPRALLGFNRFPGDSAMQGDAPGEVRRRRDGVWFGPDRFVLAIWSGVSGRALGGNRPWPSVHPDLSVESYGYRNTVAKGSLRVVPKDLFKVTDAWVTAEPAFGIKADPGKHLVMVRTVVTKGDKPPHDAADEDSYFRISATQVRLVTTKDRQYYPSGHLDRGTRFESLALDSGSLVDDYVRNQVIEDWVFQINDDERPTLIEMKQLGRSDLAGILKDQASPGLSSRDYPQHPYLKDLCTLDVQFDAKGKAILEANVYVLPATTQKRAVASEINSAFSNLDHIISSMNNGSGGWAGGDKVGVPSRSQLALAYNTGTALKAAGPEEELRWVQILPVLLAGQAEADGERNLQIYPKYINGDLMNVMAVLSSGPADAATGKAKLEKINPGERVIVATLRTDRAFYVWVEGQEFKPATHPSMALAVSGGGSPAFIIDLDAK